MNSGGSTGPGQHRSVSPLKRGGSLALATTIAFSGVGAVAVQAVQAVVAAPSAHADAPGTRLHGVVVQVPPPGGFGDWGMWLGSLVNPNGPGNGFCFEMGEDAGFTPGVEGAALDPALNKAILDNQADVSTHPALAYLVHQRKDPRFNSPAADGPNLRDSTDPQLVAIRAQAAQIIAAAEASAGPYTVQPNLTMPDGRAGTVTNTAAISAAGNPVTGLPATAVLKNAVWDSTGTDTITFTTGDVLPGFKAVASGPVGVTITGEGPGGNVKTIVVPNQQDVIVAGGTAPFTGTSVDVQAVLDFQPVATSTAPTYRDAGQDLTDTLHVATADGQPWLAPNGTNVPARFDVDWYYSPVELAPSADIPSTAVKYASGTVTANGAGDVTATADKLADKAGHYYPVARFTKAAQPAEFQQYFTGDWKAGFNDPGEHTIVKYAPQVTTKASVIENGKVHDVITVTGNEPGNELTVITDLILTSEKSVEGGKDEAPADAKVIGTVTTKVIGNGEFTTPDVVVPWEMIVTEKWGAGKPANLYFSEKIQPTNTTKGWDGKELLPGETIPVEKPSIVTKASENGVVPVVAHDTGIVSGTVPSGEGIKVTTKVNQFKFDDSTDGSAQAVCANPSFTSEDQVVTKAGEIVYPKHTLEHVGTYGYVEELNLTINKGPGKEPFTAQLHKGKCGEKNETVIVFPKDKPVTPEKPVLHVPGTPENPAPMAPVAYTGEVTANHGINAPLLFGGAAALVALLAIGTGVYVQRRKAATMTTPDTATTDEQH